MFGNPMNPANPGNMMNPMSPYYGLWHEDGAPIWRYSHPSSVAPSTREEAHCLGSCSSEMHGSGFGAFLAILGFVVFLAFLAATIGGAASK